MSKAAMNQLTRNLACEWAPSGIRVNAVAPWYTATELAQQVPNRAPPAHSPDHPPSALPTLPSGLTCHHQNLWMTVWSGTGVAPMPNLQSPAYNGLMFWGT